MAKGVIKSLKKSFGFIKTQDGKEIFFHKTALKNTSFELLKEGDVVEFNIVKTVKGPQAENIKVKEKKE